MKRPSTRAARVEGWRGDILQVTRDGKKVEYHGIMVDRDLPTPYSYFAVMKNVELSATLDVSNAYPMKVPGEDQVSCVRQRTELCEAVEITK